MNEVHGEVGRPGKAQASEDLWHLSINDLLGTPAEQARLVGGGPFVINLSTSTARIGPPHPSLRRFEGLHIYQLRRGTEPHPQFLLRLGIIASEIEADAILSAVLEHYPGATKDSVADDDRAAVVARAAPAALPEPVRAPQSKPPAQRRAALKPPAAQPPVAAKPQAPVRWDIDELLPDLAVTRASRPDPRVQSAAPPALRPQAPAKPEVKVPLAAHVQAEVVEIAAAFPASANSPPVAEAPHSPASSAAIEAISQVESSAPVPTALAPESQPTAEFEFSAPVPDAAVPLRQSAEETDYDPDAVTHEVALPAFTSDMQGVEVPAPAPAAIEAEFHFEDLAAAEAKADDVITVEALAIDSTTIEAATIEAPTVEAATIEAPTVEVMTVDAASAEPPRISEVATYEIQDFQLEQTAPHAAEPDVSAPTPESIVVAPLAAQLDSESGTLEQLVAKIEAMVESVDLHETSELSLQTPEDAVHVPAVPMSLDEPTESCGPPIDSTQTIRALTPLELAEDQSSPWFAIQLSLSEEQIDPEHVPNLDLFSEYRLYSVTGLHGERVMHALRVGFFSSELAAEAVTGYLRGFFDSPCTKRVSIAERERFAEKGVTARKDIGATGVHAVIELTSPAALPERKVEIGGRHAPQAPKSIWSRFVAPLKR